MANSFFHSAPYDPYPTVDLVSIVRSPKPIARSIKIYGSRLAEIDPSEFRHKNEYQRKALEEELLHMVNLINEECELHKHEQNLPMLRERGKQLERCAHLLSRLGDTPPMGASTSCQQNLQEQLGASPDRPAKYIALNYIAPLMGKAMIGFTTAEWLTDIRTQMSAVNYHRLNWVWGGGLDRSLLDLIPAGMGHAQQANTVFSTVSPVTGYMSFVLYYLRLGINLYLLTEGTLKGTWINADKKLDIGIYERFQTQWEQRKFAILNDVFWATANMACFYWLVGSGSLGYMGNVLTGAMLIFDLTLTAWNYLENETEHNAEIEHLKKEMDELNARIVSTEDETKKNVLKEHLAVLFEARSKSELEWKYTGQQFHHDLWYSLSLFVSFSILCSFYLPPTAILPATALILGITGSALSFALTVAYHSVTTTTEIEKLQELQSFKKTQHRQDMIAYHKKALIQQVLSETLIPTSAFVLLVFFPIHLGLPLLMLAVALMMMYGSMLEGWKPKPPPLPGDIVTLSP